MLLNALFRPSEAVTSNKKIWKSQLLILKNILKNLCDKLVNDKIKTLENHLKTMTMTI